jgi:hypothetical protein
VRADLATAATPFVLVFSAFVVLFLTFAEVERLGLAMWLGELGAPALVGEVRPHHPGDRTS